DVPAGRRPDRFGGRHAAVHDRPVARRDRQQAAWRRGEARCLPGEREEDSDSDIGTAAHDRLTVKLAPPPGAWFPAAPFASTERRDRQKEARSLPGPPSLFGGLDETRAVPLERAPSDVPSIPPVNWCLVHRHGAADRLLGCGLHAFAEGREDMVHLRE